MSMSDEPNCNQTYGLGTSTSLRVDSRNVAFCITLSSKTDVTIQANTNVGCERWKTSGMADPVLSLFASPMDDMPMSQVLASNDDGGQADEGKNCNAALLSWTLDEGTYLVIVSAFDSCSYGNFELNVQGKLSN
ncbi:unnamed protein product [Didymodactylos carnosus]|uniref:Uncharacterized protein n=1 Tax=Didymodactylos carnosus TaxID=1234261 RepID=A0A8S2F4W4_9BILA|nr:unnamed protein product [Didymodactylos carnosus]CAF4135080.1 unnamed protein product [Didymodactylos carnosus]